MLLTQDTSEGKYQIHHYQSGRIKINDRVYTQSVIVALTTLITPWPPGTADELTQEHLLILLTHHPAIVLIGTGQTGKFLPAALLAPLLNQQIGVEVMDTAAACRTFNVLAAEGRNVVAALLIDESSTTINNSNAKEKIK
jgi:uncharacterized protein